MLAHRVVQPDIIIARAKISELVWGFRQKISLKPGNAGHTRLVPNILLILIEDVLDIESLNMKISRGREN